MAKRRTSALEAIRLGSDGELISGKFCAYCGNQNAPDDAYCQHCSAFIADQGPDLTSRLARISRRASASRVYHSSRAEQLISAQTDHVELKPDLYEQSTNPTNGALASERLPISARLARVQQHALATKTTNNNQNCQYLRCSLSVG